ncbi:hypothetical protein [Pseudomonas turukhanskensis]|uniref:Uncharacterized protein n=1 Tax=Pseudomonas turukhanskensis TaxID=1806536 RepID=A0A9W6KAG3_9PSED|nr:hypothetical protein [Pseudomonas turukhanskensis]GLK90469.1 hypothetical protein GCM10017655_35330 [Pseudomonas turukhanskensis]
MVRIKGTIGAWPVDLAIELDAADWAHLATHLPTPAVAEPAKPNAPVASPSQDDKQWLVVQELIRSAGKIEGPTLLGELQALTGNASAAKRLLVRLRHSALVEVEAGADAPVYRWVG